MPLLCNVGSFSSGTGALSSTVAVTGVGFTPKLVIFWWSGRTETTDAVGGQNHHRGFGYMIDANTRGCVFSQSLDAQPNADTDCGQRIDACVGMGDETAVTGLLDAQSMDADGFTVIVDDVMPSSIRIHYMALGGPDIRSVTAGLMVEAAATGIQDIAAPNSGFMPGASDQCLIFMGAGGPTTNPPTYSGDSRCFFGCAVGGGDRPNNFVWGGGSNSGDATKTTRSYCTRGECIGELDSNTSTPDGRAAVAGWLQDGFRLSWTERVSTRRMLWVTIKGGSYRLGSLLTGTDTAPIVVAGLGLKPRGVLFKSHTLTASTPNTAQQNDWWSMGAYDGTNQRAHAVGDQNGIATSVVTTAVEHDNVYIKLTTTDTVESSMQCNSLDQDGFTAQMSVAGAASNFAWFLAVGDAPPAPLSYTSM